MKRIAIVWPGFTGYMDACWRELAGRCELRIFIEPAPLEHRFDGSELDGLDWRRIEADGFDQAIESIRSFRPDAVIVGGWSTPLARRAATADFRCRRILTFEMPWERTLRKFIARWALWPRLRRYDAVFIPGKRTLRYAEWLGFKGRIATGCNPSGWERFKNAGVAEKGFVFSGRLSEEKALDVLFAAYAQYREAVNDPWDLDIVGAGDVEVPNAAGVRRLGFAPPSRMPALIGAHASLILPSRRETWGICALEAMSAGLAVIASDACGFVDDAAPAIVFPSDNISALRDAMIRVHRMTPDERRHVSMKAQEQAERYSAKAWADRVERLLRRDFDPVMQDDAGLV